MRLLSIRLIVSLHRVYHAVSLSSSYYEVLGEKRGLRQDLERRAEVLGESLAGNVERGWRKIRRRICRASYSILGTGSISQDWLSTVGRVTCWLLHRSWHPR